MALIHWLNSIFTSGPLSVTVSRSSLRVVDVKSGRVWEDELLVAIKSEGAQKTATAFGKSAKETGDEIVNPFGHPRVLVHDYLAGEKLLQYVFLTVSGRKWVKPSPTVFLQVNGRFEGGVVAIEWRALTEMAHGAGAHTVYLSKERQLSDVEIKSAVVTARYRRDEKRII